MSFDFDLARGLAASTRRWACASLMLAGFALADHAALAAGSLIATPGSSVYLEELTWPELQSRVQAGDTTVLVPIGGTEQNGPHMVLGKHNVRVRLLAGQIAQALGHTVVAPVIAYVPEGAIQPPAAHMRFSGTLSIPEEAFEQVLEGTARSLRQHGFRHVVFMGDHGGYQRSEVRVADKLNRAWSAPGDCRVIALLAYYRALDTGFAADLQARGHSKQEIGTHAGLADTSLALALGAGLVRTDKLSQAPRSDQGVYGDPRRASAELGQTGLQHVVADSVAALRAVIPSR